ncbi:MAG: hypothetical protein ACREJ3_03160, partial [Polyangiaceae bacterium]
MTRGIRARLAALTSTTALVVAATASAAGRGTNLGLPAEPATVNLNVVSWPMIKRESGPVNYYTVMRDGALAFVRGHYTPPLQTSVLGVKVADSDRQNAREITWRWRAITLPNGGDECARGREDSAAVVYLTWKR